MSLSLVQFDSVVPVLRGLYIDGSIGHAELVRALNEVVHARSVEEVAPTLAGLELPVTFTPAGQELEEELVLDCRHSKMAMRGVWQVGRETSLRAAHGSCVLDFSRAQLDARTVDLSIDLAHSRATLIVPETMNLVVARMSGGVEIRFEQRPTIPGLPTLRLSVKSRFSNVVIRRPGEPEVPAASDSGARRARRRR